MKLNLNDSDRHYGSQIQLTTIKYSNFFYVFEPRVGNVPNYIYSLKLRRNANQCIYTTKSTVVIEIKGWSGNR